MNYSEFIEELKPLFDEACTLFDVDQTHQNWRFGTWRHKVNTTIDIIRDQGYKVDCDIQSRIFQVASYGSPSKSEQMAAYNHDLQDTINELEIIIQYYEKYGDPKRPHEVESSNNKNTELEWPNKITLAWLFNHAPINLWVKVVGILIAVFLLGVAFSQTPAYKKIQQMWTHEQSDNTEIIEPNKSPNQTGANDVPPG